MDINLFDQIPLFEKLNDAERIKLAELFVLRRHPKNTIVINEGDDSRSFYVILEGETKVSLTDEQGKEVVLNIQGTGDYFGEIALLDDGLRSALVITTQPSQFAVLNRQDFIDCVTDSPQISLKIMQGLTRRLRALSDNVRSLALMDVYGRVAHLLLELAVDSDGNKVIENKLTQNDIADRVGASSKMVGRIMRELEKGGYVLKDEKRLIIVKRLPAAW
jgi:CRP/FNR family cyclic AMP-dependent transcriptional regulator